MDKYGFPLSVWNEAKEQAKTAIRERARVRGMLPYSELVTQINVIEFEAFDHRLFDLLGEISEEEDAHK